MPFPNVFGCRLKDPAEFDENTFRTMQRKHDDKNYSVIMGQMKGDNAMTEQSFRYEKSIWTEESARTHCEDHNGSFIAGNDGENAMYPNLVILNFTHNSTVADNEPGWASVDKTALPRAAFADQGDPEQKSTWGYPHHWISGGSTKDDNGVWTNGTMYLHEGGLNAAWAAAQGARSGQEASAAVKAHLNTHRTAIGLNDKLQNLPQPESGEGEGTFMMRCMNDAQMVQELPDENQRYDVCEALCETMMGDKAKESVNFKGFEVKALTPTEAEIWLYDEIGGGGWFTDGVSAKQFADQITGLGKMSKITVRINSPGGDVFDGLAIHNILKQNPAQIIVNIDGLAASIASVIAMAGDEIHMADNALMMVHGAWTMGMGNATDFREIAARLDKVDGSIQTTYMKKTGLDHSKVVDLMNAETWMSAQEAFDLGFIDNIGEPLQMAAHFDMSKFNFKKNPPEARMPSHPEPSVSDNREPSPPDVSFFDEAIGTIKATKMRIFGGN